ncbi:hypothetical protein KY285_036257 [Solanum tuberosum]|nr:hypothetical protein KY285_036257 [Solanum tuberosum]
MDCMKDGDPSAGVDWYEGLLNNQDVDLHAFILQQTWWGLAGGAATGFTQLLLPAKIFDVVV